MSISRLHYSGFEVCLLLQFVKANNKEPIAMLLKYKVLVMLLTYGLNHHRRAKQQRE